MNLLIEGESKSGKVLSKIRFVFWRVIHSNSIRVRCTALGTNHIHKKKIEFHHFHTSGSLYQKVAKFVMFFLTGLAIIIFFYS